MHQSSILSPNILCTTAFHLPCRISPLSFTPKESIEKDECCKSCVFGAQGILDMLVVNQVEGKKDLVIHALKNNFEADAYFVKVMGESLSWHYPLATLRALRFSPPRKISSVIRRGEWRDSQCNFTVLSSCIFLFFFPLFPSRTH